MHLSHRLTRLLLLAVLCSLVAALMVGPALAQTDTWTPTETIDHSTLAGAAGNTLFGAVKQWLPIGVGLFGVFLAIKLGPKVIKKLSNA